jgi:hypothetical protein
LPEINRPGGVRDFVFGLDSPEEPGGLVGLQYDLGGIRLTAVPPSAELPNMRQAIVSLSTCEVGMAHLLSRGSLVRVQYGSPTFSTTWKAVLLVQSMIVPRIVT